MRPLTLTEVRRRAEWIVVTRLVAVGGVIGGLCFGALLHRPFDHQSWVDFLSTAGAGMASTGLLAFAALRSALRRPRPPTAVVGFSFVAAVLNPATFLAFDALVSASRHGSMGTHRLGEVLGGLAIVTLLGLILSIPLGAAYAGGHYLAFRTLHRLVAEPTHRTLGDAHTLASIVPCVGALALLVLTRFDVPRDVLGWLGALFATMVGFDLALGGVLGLRRRRWLAALRDDRLAGHRLLPSTECTVRADIAPLEPVSDGALAVVAAAPGVPYRDRPDALMLVPRR